MPPKSPMPGFEVTFKLGEDRSRFIQHSAISKAIDCILNIEKPYQSEVMQLVGELLFFKNKQAFTKAFSRKLKILDLSETEDNPICNMFIQVVDFLLGIYGPTQDTANLRGAFVEAMVFKLLSYKFRGYTPKTGTPVFVIISNNSTEWISNKTVDVAFWSYPIGECHECKVNGEKLTSEAVENLREIYAKSGNRISVAITTLHERDMLKKILLQKSIILDNVCLYGRDNIFDICN